MSSHPIHKKIDVNGLSVAYTESGPSDAPTVLFIHGFPLNRSMWKGQMEALHKHYRTIAYDVRGHGDSELGAEDFSIEQFSCDLMGFMNVLKLHKVTLCGLSMGGYIALLTVGKFPNRFNGLILCDTHCIADSTEAKEKRYKAIETIEMHGVDHYAKASVLNLFASESFTTRETEVAAAKKMISDTSDLSINRTLMALAGREETCSRLAKIKMPVLILVGKEDILTPPTAARTMHRAISGSVLGIIEHAGHLSNLENPDVFNRHLIAFLESVHHLKEDDKATIDTATKELENQQTYDQIEMDLNSKILEVTMSIRKEFPELSKFLEEMPVTVPDKANPQVTLTNLKDYHDSISAMLNKYRSEHENAA